MTPEFIFPDWPAPAHVGAAASTRVGGYSAGPFARFNLGLASGDGALAVIMNRALLGAALGLAGEPAWLQQVHGTTVLRADTVDEDADEPPQADASWADRPGVSCVVQSADCLPVLFCDDAGSVVAAAHAGWRGLAAGVLESTVAALPVPPATLMAWLGPAIGPRAFVVGGEVRDAFTAFDAEAMAAFRPAAEAGKFHADLWQLARQRLAGAGVTRVFGGGLCTHDDPERFYSYRRDGARTGRMAALVWIAA